MKIQSPTIEFNEEMFKKINEFRIANLMTRNDFFDECGISGKGTIDHWRKSKRISFKAIKKLEAIGIDLVI